MSTCQVFVHTFPQNQEARPCFYSKFCLKQGFPCPAQVCQQLSRFLNYPNTKSVAFVCLHHWCFHRFSAEMHRYFFLNDLTHLPIVPHTCLSGQHCCREWLVTYLVPSHNNAGLLSIEPLGTNFSEILIKIQIFHSWKCIWKYRLLNSSHFVQEEMS